MLLDYWFSALTDMVNYMVSYIWLAQVLNTYHICDYFLFVTLVLCSYFSSNLSGFCVCVFLIEWLTYNSVTSISNTVIHYFCTLKNDHHCKSSYHLSPHQITTLSLTVSPTLYTRLCDTLFCSGNLHLSRSLSHHPSPLANTYLFSTSLITSGCSFVSFFKFHIQVKSYYIVFSIWLFPLA